MKTILTALLLTLSVAFPLSAESLPDDPAGACPAVVPVIKAANGNYVWLDTTAVSKQCLALLSGSQDGDPASDDANGDGVND